MRNRHKRIIQHCIFNLKRACAQLGANSPIKHQIWGGQLGLAHRSRPGGPEDFLFLVSVPGIVIGQQLGIGNIGAEVFRLARPFGLKFIAHDPYQDPKVAAELGVELVGIEELFRRADFLSVSVPLSEATHHIVGERLLKLMQPTAYVINTARGPVVDQRALHRALVDGTIAGAGLDVFEVEPCPADEPIFQSWRDDAILLVGTPVAKLLNDHGRSRLGS